MDASGWTLRFLLAIIFVLQAQTDELRDDKTHPKIGIVGAGIGGTSTAYYLRELFGDQAQIDIFEKKAVGGRLATVNIGGHEYEAGGSIIHPKNMYMVNFTKMLGLEQLEKSVGILGIFDGEEMRFSSSDYRLLALAKLFWRYGMDIYSLQSWVQDKMMNKFMKIYDIQNAGYAYTTVTDLIAAMDPVFVSYMKKSMKYLMKKEGFSSRFTEEFVMGAMRMNYGQSTDISGFVGAVSLAGAEPGLWAVKGGNKKVPEGLIKKTGSNLIQGDVKTVRFTEYQDSNYEIDYVTKNEKGEKKRSTNGYDLVVIATPLHDGVSDIEFEDFLQNIENFPQKFHTTVATFVDGVPNHKYYGYESMDKFPTSILTCNDTLFFNSYGRHSDVNGERPKTGSEERVVGKIFSNKPPSEEDVQRYFKSKEDVRIIEWLAYPEYNFKVDDLPPFVLHDQLYYVNAVELSASAMEMSVIGARNVALLAYNHWHSLLEKIDEPYNPKPSKYINTQEL